MAILGECDGVTVSRKHEGHEARDVFVAMAEESQAMAPLASRWCGYQIPPEIAFVTMWKEGGGHNLNRDHVADPWHRSTGFFAMRPSCYSKFSVRAGLPVPTHEEWGTANEWSLEVCAFNRDHPIYQVRVYFAAAAYYLRQEDGDVRRFFSIWRYGYNDPLTGYATDCARLWRKKFGVESWPVGGRLKRLR